MAQLMFTGCSTMKVTPLTASQADSYPKHQEVNGIVVGIQPMTDAKEIKDTFKVNLLDKGVLPVLVVVENKRPDTSITIVKDKVCLRDQAAGTSSLPERKKVTSDTGKGLAAAGAVLVACCVIPAIPVLFEGMQMNSNASIIEFNLGDEEFYTHTLGPGEKAQGFVYFQLVGGTSTSGNYHLIAEVNDPASHEATTFDFPMTLNLPKK